MRKLKLNKPEKSFFAVGIAGTVYLVIYILIYPGLISLGMSYLFKTMGILKETRFIMQILIFILYIAGGFRLKWAYTFYKKNNMSFREAHRASRAEIFLHLSYLPVVGNLFKSKPQKENEVETNE